jgi:hypothetical protein
MKWMKNSKGFGRKWLWPNVSIIPEFEWVHEANHKYAVRITSVPAEVRTDYFQNTSPDLYLYISLFGGKRY